MSQANKISTLKNAVREIACADDLRSLTGLVMDHVMLYTDAKSASIMLVDDNGELAIEDFRGNRNASHRDIRVRLGEKICGKVAEERKPLLVTDIYSDKRIRKPFNGGYSSGSFISCPIMMQEKLLGVINITDKPDGAPFTEEEFHVIEILAGQMALAMEHIRVSTELISLMHKLNKNMGIINSDQLKAELIARMSHDFRTPLNSIYGAVYYLREKKTSSVAEQSDFIDIISDESRKLINILDEFLNLSSLENPSLISPPDFPVS